MQHMKSSIFQSKCGSSGFKYLGKKYYSKLDISQAFTHIEGSEEEKNFWILIQKGLYQMYIQ